MNEIVNKFLLEGDKFMPEMHLRQPQFVDSACGAFTKNKKRIQDFKETGDTSYIYKNELDKACFQHDMANGDFKDLPKRTAADEVLRDKAFKIASDQKYDGYQKGLASMVYKFFDKKSQGKGLASNKENMQLADELHKQIIRKFNKRKVYSSFKDNKVSDKDPKFKVGDHVRISKYKSTFAKRYMPNWSEEIFIIKKIRNTVPWTYVINDLNGEEIIGTFYENELQKTDQKEFRMEKVLKKKGDKLYVKWKGYDNSFNSWIDKKDIV